MRSRYLPFLLIIAFTTLALYVSGVSKPDGFEASKEMIVLRKIGHEILLNAGDKHSRVLPVKKISSHEFRVSFENPVALVPDSMLTIVKRIAKEHRLAEFSLNVLDCRQAETMYGFTVSSLKENKLETCLGRALPKDCYHLSIMFPGTREKNTRRLLYSLAGLGIAASLFFLLRHRVKNKPPVDRVNELSGNKELVQIGKYFFHPGQQYLELHGIKNVLTHKEARLLHLFAMSPNTVIERTLLQKEVWENEGVIVTRSLDMFISKLRKKLSGDTDIKIVNAHGKGYKLEIIERTGTAV